MSVVDQAFSVTPTGAPGDSAASDTAEGEEPTIAQLMAEIKDLQQRVFYLERRVIPDRSGEPIFDSMSASG